MSADHGRESDQRFPAASHGCRRFCDSKTCRHWPSENGVAGSGLVFGRIHETTMMMTSSSFDPWVPAFIDGFCGLRPPRVRVLAVSARVIVGCERRDPK